MYRPNRARSKSRPITAFASTDGRDWRLFRCDDGEPSVSPETMYSVVDPETAEPVGIYFMNHVFGSLDIVPLRIYVLYRVS